MNRIVLGILLGVAAGVIDCLPMVRQRLPTRSIISAFFQWLFLGVVISTCNIGLPGWLQGTILGVAGAIPIVMLAVGDKQLYASGSAIKTVIVILAGSLVLGGLIGFFSDLIGK